MVPFYFRPTVRLCPSRSKFFCGEACPYQVASCSSPGRQAGMDEGVAKYNNNIEIFATPSVKLLRELPVSWQEQTFGL